MNEEILFLEDAFKTFLRDKKVEMNNHEQYLSSILIKDIYLTISKYAKQHRIQIVIDKGKYFYYEHLIDDSLSSPGDITAIILKKLKQ